MKEILNVINQEKSLRTLLLTRLEATFEKVPSVGSFTIMFLVASKVIG